MKKVNSLAIIVLTTMFLLMLGSAWNDSTIMDELAHIPAGFGYVTKLDYRLNPEHPPLIKVISALFAFIAQRPYFPTDTSAWQQDVNGQWSQGDIFLYGSGNNADRIIFWTRFPLMLLAVAFGWLLFSWAKQRFGQTAALLTLMLFAFSPTVLAHSRYVTTDLGAAFGFFIGIISFLAFLERPAKKSIIWAGVCLGIALLLKFSTVLLLPMYGVLLIAWAVSRPHLVLKERFRVGTRLLARTILIGIVSLFVVGMAYGVLITNYPQERQLADATFLLSSYGFRPAVNFDLALMKNPITRPLGQYILGVLMVQQRAAGGNTAYFLGEVSAQGSRTYFPILYLLKEPLALHILSLIALWVAIKNTCRPSNNSGTHRRERTRAWIEHNFAVFAAIVAIAVYWITSIRSPLNIGIRHMLPTFPFIYLIVSRQLAQWLARHDSANPQTWFEWLTNVYQLLVRSLPRYALVGVLMIWLVLGTLAAFPGYLSYYNELARGTENGYIVAVDSNYDWGQDLKRLADYVQRHDIQRISLDYFGGGNIRYYLGDRVMPMSSSAGPAHGWFAISATLQEGAFGVPTHGFVRRPEDAYEWLKPYPAVGRIGQSIFLYKLP